MCEGEGERGVVSCSIGCFGLVGQGLCVHTDCRVIMADDFGGVQCLVISPLLIFPALNYV